MSETPVEEVIYSIQFSIAMLNQIEVCNPEVLHTIDIRAAIRDVLNPALIATSKLERSLRGPSEEKIRELAERAEEEQFLSNKATWTEACMWAIKQALSERGT